MSSFQEGYPVYICRHCGRFYWEHGDGDRCPEDAQNACSIDEDCL